jgi:hypothetical protein
MSKKFHITKEWLYQKLITEAWLQKDVATFLGCSGPYISELVKKYQIPSKPSWGKISSSLDTRQRKIDWHRSHKKHLAEWHKRWREEHPEQYRLGIQNRYLKIGGWSKECERLRMIVLEHYGKRCACCGETGSRFLTIDHKNNDGSTKRKRQGGFGLSFYKWIITHAFPEDLQILCWNCNCGRHLNNGRCPHSDQQFMEIATDVSTSNYIINDDVEYSLS